MVRQSSQVSFTSLESGPFSTHTAYLSSVETISEDAKTDHEVVSSYSFWTLTSIVVVMMITAMSL